MNRLGVPFNPSFIPSSTSFWTVSLNFPESRAASKRARSRPSSPAKLFSGKDLSRERLITTLEGLYEYETGLIPRITFGPNRRIGALGAYIVTIDPEKKLFPASVEWIAVD